MALNIVITLLLGGLLFVGFKWGAFALGGVSWDREEQPVLFWVAMVMLALMLLAHVYLMLTEPTYWN